MGFQIKNPNTPKYQNWVLMLVEGILPSGRLRVEKPVLVIKEVKESITPYELYLFVKFSKNLVEVNPENVFGFYFIPEEIWKKEGKIKNGKIKKVKFVDQC